MSKKKMGVNQLKEYMLASDSSDDDDEYFTDIPSPNTYKERAQEADNYYNKKYSSVLKNVKKMDDGKERYPLKEEVEAEKWKEKNIDMLRKYSPEPDFPLHSSLTYDKILKMKTPELKKEIKYTTAVKNPKISAALAKQEIEKGLKNPAIKAKIKAMGREQAVNDLSAFFGNPNPTYKSRKPKFHQYYGGRKTRRKRKSKYKVRMAKRKTRRRVKRRKTRRRVKRRKKRKTRKAGNPPKQSDKAGIKGLTQREIDARERLTDARLKKDKEERLKRLRAFNKKLARHNAFGSTRENLDLKMHQASDDYVEAFKNLRVSPITTKNKDKLDLEMEKFQRKMSPIAFEQKPSNGGKKRKTRKRKMRGGSDGETPPPPPPPEKPKYSDLDNQTSCLGATPSGVWNGSTCSAPGGGGKRKRRGGDKHEEIKAGIENGSLRPVGDKYPGWYFDVQQLINSPSTTYYQVKRTTGEVINDGTSKHPKETKVKRGLLSVKRKFDRLTKKAGKRKKRKTKRK